MGYAAIMGVPLKLILDNTTSPGYKLHIETMYVMIKKIVELSYCSTLSQSFIINMLPYLVYSLVCKLYLNKTLGYTALMGVPPILLPMFVSFT